MNGELNLGTQVPSVERTPDAIDLFMFSASAWLLHRIHYDLPFTTEHDGHPGLLVHGPLQGTYMIQAAQSWLGRSAQIRSITYRHKAPAYLGDTLECGGTVVAIDPMAGTVDLELWARKTDGTVTTEGTATFAMEG
jgi:hydroxyacyl-ACP dehydratase HTD2-like protein with hotdog domain